MSDLDRSIQQLKVKKDLLIARMMEIAAQLSSIEYERGQLEERRRLQTHVEVDVLKSAFNGLSPHQRDERLSEIEQHHKDETRKALQQLHKVNAEEERRHFDLHAPGC